MNFAEPLWLIAGLAACTFLWWQYRRFDRKQHLALTTFVSPHLLDQLARSVSAGRRTLKHALVIGGVACVFIALRDRRRVIAGKRHIAKDSTSCSPSIRPGACSRRT